MSFEFYCQRAAVKTEEGDFHRSAVWNVFMITVMYFEKRVT